MRFIPFIPWIDEIMTLEPVIAFKQHNKFVDPSFIYLHQIFLTIWLSFFDISYFSVRSFNLLFVICTYLVIDRIFLKDILKSNINERIIFILLYFMSYTIFFQGNSGRIDAVGAFVVISFSALLIRSIKEEKKYQYFISFFGGYVIYWSGISQVPIVYLILFTLFLIFPQKKIRIFKILTYFSLGLVVGFSSFLYYLNFNGITPIRYIIRIFGFSESAKELSYNLLHTFPSILEYLSLDLQFIEKWNSALNNSIIQQEPLYIRIYNAYLINKEYLIVIIILTFSYIRNRNKNNTSLTPFIICTIIPLFMGIIGRYPFYYTWMGYLPSIILLSLIPKSKLNITLIGLYILFTILFNIQLSYERLNKYARIEEFVEKQKFNTNSYIYCSYPVYYSVYNKTKNIEYPDRLFNKNPKHKKRLKKIDFAFCTSSKTCNSLIDYLNTTDIEYQTYQIESMQNPDIIYLKIDYNYQ
ncbi:hypothetical protein [Flammeovirga pacifica]|uniref:Glycosyltransferase RgtA/B/C/D-like domain-containing protein n=1 Tax=Flammeovirga pacifica TaxID=915059 RepID=A0A1S1YV96_FLAPC|nr:hypothetical protein [Flammeovirga pacifica]OHX64942.1 hypothetical protein NH26_00560 [Flammeovirga pacifica]